jgi:LysM repeat protein
MKASTLRPFLAAAVVLAPFLGLYHWQAERATPAVQQVIGSASGMADITRHGEQMATSASQQALFAGDAVRALDLVRLTFGEGSVVEMAPGAALLIQEARLEDGIVWLRQQAGRVNVDTTNPLFRIEAPTVSLSVNKARFSVELDGGDAYVTADQGMVYGKSDGQDVSVAAGETLRTGVGQRAKLQVTTPVVMPPPPPPPPRTATPTVTPVPPTQPPIIYHVIVAGDTLTYLANVYGVTVDAIVKANNITDANVLHIGDKLIVPSGK